MTNVAPATTATGAGNETANMAAATKETADKTAEAAKIMPSPPAPVVQQPAVIQTSPTGTSGKDLPPPPSTGNMADDHLVTSGAKAYYGVLLTTPITKNNITDLTALEEKCQKMFEEAQALDRMRRDHYTTDQI